VFPDAVVAPYLEVGGSDSRLFEDLTPNVFRFMPFRLSREDLKGIHGTNERLSVESLARAVSFYMRLVRNAAG
jgi:carboxypeptidase PM20D1